MANLSQIKRERMINFLNTIKKEHTDAESVLAINEIENELTNKKYGLVWEQHEERVDVLMKTKIPVFTELKDMNINDDIKGNVNFILEGDNLHSLKLLEKTHKEKIDVIYIDPPYNTGSKDFTYDDIYVDSNDGFRHSKWLSFMYKRLLIAHKLLSNRGSIFISIDDNEVSALKLLCDEIFGDENFVANVIWEKKFSPQNDSKWLSDSHDHILVFAKNKSIWRPNLLGRTDEMNNRYKNLDNDIRGPWTSSDFSVRTYNENCDYPITTPSGRVITPSDSRCWMTSKEKFNELVADNRIWFGKSGGNVPRIKTFLSEVQQGSVSKTIWYRSEVGDTQEGTKDLKAIFNGRGVFTSPKPVRLIKRVLELATKEDSIVLDFFAGSGTTGQAVLEFNKANGGNRAFILCTNNQNNICKDITYNRVRSVITGYDAKGINKIDGITANVCYYKTDFVDKVSNSNKYDVSEKLKKHITEMVQLEHGVIIDNDNYKVILSDEEADLFEKSDNIYNCKGIYMSSDVFLTREQKNLFSGIDIKIIPDYYFHEELRELGEI